MIAAQRDLLRGLISFGETLLPAAEKHREPLAKHFGYDVEALRFGIESLRLGLVEWSSEEPTQQVKDLQDHIFGGSP